MKKHSSIAKVKVSVWVLLVLMGLTITRGLSHTVWLEPASDDEISMMIRFAEPGNEFETSPGYLDGLSEPRLIYQGNEAWTALVPRKASDGFIVRRRWSTDTVAVESTYTVRGGRKPIFYARWQPSLAEAGEAALTMDLVPTGEDGGVRVYFRGAPLGGVTLVLRTPDGEEEELSADESGLVRIESKQSGLHILMLAHHREPLGGFHLGKAYDRTSHNAALTWRQ